MGRLAILLLPLFSACAAAYEAGAPASASRDEPEGIAISSRVPHPGLLGRLQNQGGLALDSSLIGNDYPAADPFAPKGHEERELEVYDLRAKTLHTLEKNDPLTGTSNTTPSTKPSPAPPPEAPPARTAQQQERAVIYTGSLALQVPDPEGLELEVAAIAKGLGGWVSKIERPRITLRVPAARFEEAMKALSALGQVLDRKISGQDVTDQYRDLRIRLENAERVRVRLAALLEQAKNVQDALAVEKELGRVTEEIERYKGQIAAMQDQVAFSSVTLELRRSLPIALRQRRFPFPWVHRLGAEALLRF